MDKKRIIISVDGILKLINRENENSEIKWILIKNGNYYLYISYLLDLHNKEKWGFMDFWPIFQVKFNIILYFYSK